MNKSKIFLLILSIFVLSSCSLLGEDKETKKEVETTPETKLTESSMEETETSKEDVLTETQESTEAEDTSKESGESEDSDKKGKDRRGGKGGRGRGNIDENSPKSHNGTVGELAYTVGEVKELMAMETLNDKKIAFLTFDDGPNNSITPQIVDILKEKNAYGTFFMIGKQIDEDTADLIKRIYNDGHSIATHSYTHDYETLYPNGCSDVEKIMEETKVSIKAIKSILGKDFYSGVFRYPGGHMSWNKDCLVKSNEALLEKGIDWIDWNSMNGDADANMMPNTVQEAVDNVFKSLEWNYNTNVAVVLMHDTYGKDLTVQSLPHIIDKLREKGYEFGVLE